MLYRLTLWSPCPDDRRSQEVTNTRVVGTLARARQLAAEWLAPHAIVTTSYYVSRDLQRAPDVFVRSLPAFRSPMHRETITPTVTIVPSVGELGYW